MATPSASTADKNVLECVWASKPIYTRRTIPELDLLPEEQEQNGLEDTTGGEGDDRDTEERETVFYEAFRMKRKATAFRGSKRMLAGKIELHTYRLGDTVMVETDTLYIMKKPPSIGVIVAMWETRVKHAEQQTDSSSMRIRIHWFLRPQEMASVRAKREHEENEVYYSLATRVVVTPAVILTRCLVSAKLDPTGKKPEPKRAVGWDLVPVTPSKRRPSSPLKKSTRFSTATEDDSEEDDFEKQVDETSFVNDPDKMFYCRLAVDSRRGIFYDFDWEKHHRDALARSKPPAEDFTPGPSKQPSRPWGEGSSWDVVEQKKPKRPTTTKAAKTRDRSDEGISESEADDSDEFEEDGSQPECCHR
ncbi:hypothetical protein NLJ89_g9313 [Agrocybe chaxingu]|uniref:BAH domain-containing protein n=1 Tax=Agrocybe chaxingu TaxID=84603 RepID=A0A9W8JSP1_9AGAR|nr:hypothetical protein NLJ89_g9313 [Agrocybe chaxingu]